jgi:hypothetical protein
VTTGAECPWEDRAARAAGQEPGQETALSQHAAACPRCREARALGQFVQDRAAEPGAGVVAASEGRRLWRVAAASRSAREDGRAAARLVRAVRWAAGAALVVGGSLMWGRQAAALAPGLAGEAADLVGVSARGAIPADASAAWLVLLLLLATGVLTRRALAR